MQGYKDMTPQELDEAKYALDEKMRQLRQAKLDLTDEEKIDGAVINQINDELLRLRAEKLAIQKEQDSRPQPALDPNAHTLSNVGNIASEEKVAGLGD